MFVAIEKKTCKAILNSSCLILYLLMVGLFCFVLFPDLWSSNIYFIQALHTHVSQTSFYWVRFTSAYLIHIALSLGSRSSLSESGQAGLFTVGLTDAD